MHHILKLLFLSLLITSTGQADSRYVSTYCNQIAQDGTWAFSFAETSATTNCQLATQGIRSVSWAPITYQHWGYYQTAGWNVVEAQCYAISQTYAGYGIEPLQRAYYSLANYGSGCRFWIH